LDYKSRHKNLIKLLESQKLDVLLIKKKQNICYLTGARGDDSVLFFSSGGNFLITDARYEEEYTGVLKDCGLKIIKDKNIYSIIEELCVRAGLKRVGFESDNFLYSQYVSLKKNLKGRKVVPVKGLTESLRMIKSPGEVGCLREACLKGRFIMDYALQNIKEAVTEMSVKNRIEAYAAKKGFKLADFDIIVASGRNAAMPHALPSEKIIRRGEMVIIDLGIMNYGYNSDLTRTVFLGKINREYSRVYNIVSDAQQKAIERIKPGVRISLIDNISRQYISVKGFGKYFIHSLGHGIGLEVHESPRISAANDTILKENMTLTIEPGVYIPGWGGVRIEDDILVTETGSEVLTKKADEKWR
jgi:Xaa-Pro aminopeptidase